MNSERSPARELFRSLRPWNAENRRTIALAYLDQEGDLPAGVVYSFSRVVDHVEGAELEREMTELRAQHFKRLGKPVPPDNGPPLR